MKKVFVNLEELEEVWELLNEFLNGDEMGSEDLIIDATSKLEEIVASSQKAEE